MEMKMPLRSLQFILVVVVVFAANYAVTAQTQSPILEWKELVSAEGKFKMTFPGAAKRNERETETAAGKVKKIEFGVDTPKKEHSC